LGLVSALNKVASYYFEDASRLGSTGVGTEQLSLRFTTHATGRIDVDVTLKSATGTERHEYQTQIDQSYVLPVIHECGALLKKYSTSSRSSRPRRSGA
jgi:hypothetical protein